jgi:hypothetical protein
VVRVGESRSPWRALRPVLLAGAAAFTWLTFSATSASADLLPDTSSLLGGVTSSTQSVTENLVPVVPAPPVQGPAAPPAAGLLQPVAEQVSTVADNLVASVPVVNQVVPAGTVTAISEPVAQIADGATSAVVETVVPPVVATLPVLEPVVQPVADVVTGAAPLPVPVPELPEVASAEPAADVLQAVPADTGIESAVADAAFAGDLSLEAAPALFAAATPGTDTTTLAGASAVPPGGQALPAMSGDQPETTDGSPHPVQVPAAPGSGSGSGASSAGSGGSTAWLNTFNFNIPDAGPVRAGEASEHAPAPVSFDPGSSPD